MTIFITVSKVSKTDVWEYWYSEIYNMVSVDRLSSRLPYSTLQGAYNLIVKTDAYRIISYFETVTAAEITYWKVVPMLEVPQAKRGQISVAKDIDDGQSQAYFTNPDYTIFYTRLGEPVKSTELKHIAIGEQVIVDVTQEGMLVGVWMLDLPTEIGEKFAKK